MPRYSQRDHGCIPLHCERLGPSCHLCLLGAMSGRIGLFLGELGVPSLDSPPRLVSGSVHTEVDRDDLQCTSAVVHEYSLASKLTQGRFVVAYASTSPSPRLESFHDSVVLH